MINSNAAVATNMILTNADGSVWTAMRTVKGRSTLFAAIRSQNGKAWIEVPATDVIAMAKQSQPKTAPKTVDRKSQVSKSLRELSMQYAAGGVR